MWCIQCDTMYNWGILELREFGAQIAIRIYSVANASWFYHNTLTRGINVRKLVHELYWFPPVCKKINCEYELDAHHSVCSHTSRRGEEGGSPTFFFLSNASSWVPLFFSVFGSHPLFLGLTGIMCFVLYMFHIFSHFQYEGPSSWPWGRASLEKCWARGHNFCDVMGKIFVIYNSNMRL